MKNLASIEDRLLNNSIYRALMSLIWPYQRAELLEERKTLIEFCTLMAIFYSVSQFVEHIANASTAFYILFFPFICVLAPLIATTYWYVLRYTYDIVMQPIEGEVTYEHASSRATFIEQSEILYYTTPKKILTALILLILMRAPNLLPITVMQLLEITMVMIYVLMVIDLVWVAWTDYQDVLSEIYSQFEDENDRFMFDQSKLNEQQAETSTSDSVNILVCADLSKSDKENQEIFLSALAQARKIVEQQNN